MRARKHQHTNKKQTQNQTSKKAFGVLYLSLMFLFLFCFCIPVFCANPTPSLSHTPSNPSKSGCCILSGDLSRKPLHRAMSAYCQYHCNRSIHTCMICFNNFFRILMNVQIYAMLIAWRSQSAMITIYYRSIRYFSRSLSQNILQRLLQFGSHISAKRSNQ